VEVGPQQLTAAFDGGDGAGQARSNDRRNEPDPAPEAPESDARRTKCPYAWCFPIALASAADARRRTDVPGRGRRTKACRRPLTEIACRLDWVFSYLIANDTW